MTETRRQQLFDYLVTFYARHDYQRVDRGDIDIDGLLDYALNQPNGVEKLNSKLQAKYGEDLDTFLINSAQEKHDEETSDEEVQPLEHAATMSRPVMKRGDRRRPSHQPKFNALASEQEQMDSIVGVVVEEAEQQQLVSPAVRFGGMGFDKSLIEEMQEHKLRNSSSTNTAEEEDKDGQCCNKFRLDLDSPEFAMCKCGYYRDDHVKRKSTVHGVGKELKNLLKARKRESELSPPQTTTVEVPLIAEVKPPAPPPPKIVVPVSKPSTTATNQQPVMFIPKPGAAAPAKPAATAPAKPAATAPVKPPPPSAIGMKKLDAARAATDKAAEACLKSTFQLNVSAAEYGVCAKCGWKKHEHVKLEKEKQVEPRPVSIKPSAPQQPCANFALDLVGEGFGACAHCGFAKKDHHGQINQKNAVRQSLKNKWAHIQHHL